MPWVFGPADGTVRSSCHRLVVLLNCPGGRGYCCARIIFMSNVARSSSPADVSRCRCVRCVFAAVSPARPIVVSSPSGLGYVTGAMVPVEPEPETDSDNEPLSQQLPIIPRPVSPSQLSDSTDGPSGSPPTVQLPIVIWRRQPVHCWTSWRRSPNGVASRRRQVTPSCSMLTRSSSPPPTQRVPVARPSQTRSWLRS